MKGSMIVVMIIYIMLIVLLSMGRLELDKLPSSLNY